MCPVNVECDPASMFMCADQAKCVDIHFCCEASHIQDCAEGSEEIHSNITGKIVSVVLCGSWHC